MSSSYWQDDDDDKPFVVPDDIQDLHFDIQCKMMLVDHAEPLSSAIHTALPWFASEPDAALHLIHVADSGNGWERPEEADEWLYLSRRTKLVLRLPKARIEQAKQELEGEELIVSGQPMQVGKAKAKKLMVHPALYARYVVCDKDEEEEEEEEDFLQRQIAELNTIGIRFKKILCGKMHSFDMAGASVYTRSLFVADLKPEDSIRLQEKGVGTDQCFGFGVFIPHKTVNKVSS